MYLFTPKTDKLLAVLDIPEGLITFSYANPASGASCFTVISTSRAPQRDEVLTAATYLKSKDDTAGYKSQADVVASALRYGMSIDDLSKTFALTGAEVWQAYTREDFASPPFTEPLSKSNLGVMRSFVEKAPDVLAGHLSAELSYRELLRVRLAYLTYLTQNDYAQALTAVTGRPRDRLQDGLIRQRDEYAQAIEGLPGKYEEGDDIQAMMQVVGLSIENFRAYAAGHLTIGELLRRQPELIVDLRFY